MKALLISIFLFGGSVIVCTVTPKTLIIGDSLIGSGSGLAQELVGHYDDAVLITKKGSSPRTWVKKGWLSKVQAENNPDVLIVVLGTNSLRTPPKVLRKHVQDFLEQVTADECYWIGPPNLVEGGGRVVKALPSMFEDTCQYYDTSKKIVFPPKSVRGFHITRWKGKTWGTAFLTWVSSQQ